MAGGCRSLCQSANRRHHDTPGLRLRELGVQDLERHLSVELGIGGLIDLPHPPPSPMRAVTS